MSGDAGAFIIHHFGLFTVMKTAYSQGYDSKKKVFLLLIIREDNINGQQPMLRQNGDASDN